MASRMKMTFEHMKEEYGSIPVVLGKDGVYKTFKSYEDTTGKMAYVEVMQPCGKMETVKTLIDSNRVISVYVHYESWPYRDHVCKWTTCEPGHPWGEV